MHEANSEGDAVLGSEFTARLEEICRMIGTKKQAAMVAGISEDMMHRYIRGDSKPSLQPMAKLCHHSGKSLDWLVYGHGTISQSMETSGNPLGLHLDMMEEVIEVTQEWLQSHNEKLSPKKTALLMREVYEDLDKIVREKDRSGHPDHFENGFGVRKLYKRFKTLIRLASA